MKQQAEEFVATHPQFHPITGQDEAIILLQESFDSGRMPHAWLIAGPKGTGKATLAWRLACAVLSGSRITEVDENLPVIRRIAARSHTDLLIIEPAFDPKKQEQKREIGVEEARQAAAFLSLTPAEGEWRVVIIDSADELNTNAANALLKTLEEPPARALLLLVSHNPGKLLPTIRSRCRLLKLPPLSPPRFAQALDKLAPELSEENAARLGLLSGNSPGLALHYYHADALEMYEKLAALSLTLPHFSAKEANVFADRLMAGSQHVNWALFTQLMLVLLSRATVVALEGAEDEIAPGEGEALAHLARLYGPARLAELYSQAVTELSQAAHSHLDYRTAVLSLFHRLGEAARISA